MKLGTVVMGVALLGAGWVAHLAVAANPCTPNTCRGVISTCEADQGCGGLSGNSAASCRNTCKRAAIDACKGNPAVCSGSPSGAFLG